VRQPKCPRPIAAAGVARMGCGCAWNLLGYLPGAFACDRGLRTWTPDMKSSSASVHSLAEAVGQ
jgi:hypothetical protein